MKFFTMCTFAGEENIKEQKKVQFFCTKPTNQANRGGVAGPEWASALKKNTVNMNRP